MRTDQGSHPRIQQRWIVIGVTFVTLGLAYGIWYSYSVFLVAFLREFGWSRSLVAGAFSVFALVHGCMSPIAGWVGSRAGPRRLIMAGGCALGCGLLLVSLTREWWHLYLAFGVIAAVGVGAAGWVPSVLIVRGWFPDRVGTALGIASAGSGVGISGMVPLTQFLFDRIGWRWAFRVLAALTVGFILPAVFWLVRDPPLHGETGSGPRPRSDRRSLDGGAYLTLYAAVRDWRFWGLGGVAILGNLGPQMLLIHQVAYLVDHGISLAVAAAVAGLVGLVSIPGKMGWGMFSDRTSRELAYTLAFVSFGVSLGVLVLAGRHPGSGLAYLYAVLVSLGYSATAPLMPASASDLYGGPRFSTIFGTMHIGNSIGTATGAWIAGRIFDQTQSYAGALWVALGSTVLTPVLLWIVAPRRPHPPPGSRH